MGGLAVAGPVIAHLLARPKFRRLPFTMLRFLRTGQVESQSRRKLRDLLILLLRCAIIVLIAILFARPLLHTSPDREQEGSVYFLGLDNSMSMAYSDADGSYFDRMVEQAVEYINSVEVDSGAAAFHLCALASGNWLRNLNKEQALAEIKAMKIEPDSARRISDFLSCLSQANISAAIFSDFTPHTLKQLVGIEEPAGVSVSRARAPSTLHYKIIAAKQAIDNAAIEDARAVGLAEGKLTLSASVVNFGQTEQIRQLTASTGSSSSTPAEIRLSPGQRRTCQLQIEIPDAGQEHLCLPVELSLSGADGLKEDDTFYLAVSVPGQEDVNVLITGDSFNQLFLLKTAIDTLSQMNPYGSLKARQVLFNELGQPDFDWADVVICSTTAERLNTLTSDVQNFVETGGRFINFVTEPVTPGAAEQLWRRNLLAAKPAKSLRKRTYLQPASSDSQAGGMDSMAAKSLANYRIDKVLMKGYFECTPHAESRCLWQFQDGTGFIYYKKCGSGCSIFVNTSIDDSLGTLTKSNASVAFCQYLLGRGSRISEHCFERNERVLLPLPEAEASVRSDAVRRSLDKMPSRAHYEQQFYVKTCDGIKRPAAVADSFLLIPDPAGIGWVKTLDVPPIYAGINLPGGETDMTKPTEDELAVVMNRTFHTDTEGDVTVRSDAARRSSKMLSRAHYELWKIIAWLVMLLLLVEPVVANRLKR